MSDRQVIALCLAWLAVVGWFGVTAWRTLKRADDEYEAEEARWLARYARIPEDQMDHTDYACGGE